MILSVRMNRQIALQAIVAGQDQYGAPSTTWAAVATVWASVEDVKGHEYMAAGGTQNAAITKIMIRHREGVVPAMRVVYGADIYNIEAVLGQDNRTLLLMCSRGANNG